MYLRSAPLQNAPETPRSTTTRTRSSRASSSPAWRRSCAVSTSSELNRFGRSSVSVATPPSTHTFTWSPTVPPLSADPRHRVAVRLGQEPLAEAGLEHDAPGVLGAAHADDGRVAAQRMRAQRKQNLVHVGGGHAEDGLAL